MAAGISCPQSLGRRRSCCWPDLLEPAAYGMKQPACCQQLAACGHVRGCGGGGTIGQRLGMALAAAAHVGGQGADAVLADQLAAAVLVPVPGKVLVPTLCGAVRPPSPAGSPLPSAAILTALRQPRTVTQLQSWLQEWSCGTTDKALTHKH